MDLAHLFFQRCLDGNVTPYIVTKKTVFKWQEGFWATMKQVFDDEYHEKFEKAGLLERCGGKLQHLISDAATMQLIRWTDGGFGMAAHNYDGTYGGDAPLSGVVRLACLSLSLTR